MPQAGKRGRRPQRQGADRYAIKWAHQYLRGDLAPLTYPLDVSQGITDFGLDGNGPDPTLTITVPGVDLSQGVGDCGPCGYEHDRMLAGATPTANETVELYFRYTDNQDSGVVIADFLLWLYRQKLIEGFAPVELATVDQIMAEFGRGIVLGVNLTDDADQLFSEGKPWTVANGETPDQNEGHVVLKVKSQGASGANGYGTVVTWGALQEADWTWLQACVEEAWIILTTDDAAKLGPEAFAALQADLNALPNATDVPPVPVPTPPSPAPPAPVVPPAPPTPEPPSPAPSPSNVIHKIEHLFNEFVASARSIVDAFIAEVEGK